MVSAGNLQCDHVFRAQGYSKYHHDGHTTALSQSRRTRRPYETMPYRFVRAHARSRGSSGVLQGYQHLRQILIHLGNTSANQDCHEGLTADNSHRLALIFYCIGSLDILDLLKSKTSEVDRQTWAQWIWEQYTSMSLSLCHELF